MTNCIVFATIKAKPGFEKQVQAVLQSLIPPTHAEPGCINYDLHKDNADEQTYYFHETWLTDAHLEAHLQTQHFKDGAEALEPITDHISIIRATKL